MKYVYNFELYYRKNAHLSVLPKTCLMLRWERVMRVFDNYWEEWEENVHSERFGNHLEAISKSILYYWNNSREKEKKLVFKCRYRTHMNQNNSTWSGLQKKSIENTKTTLKEHEKEQRKKWNNKATQRMNIQEKYTICFESGIDNTVYRHLKMEHYSTFDKNIPATCHSAALLWYIQYNQRYTCTCILKILIYWIYWNWGLT